MQPLRNLSTLPQRLDALPMAVTVAVVCPNDEATRQTLRLAMAHEPLSLMLFACSEGDLCPFADLVANGRATAHLAPTPAEAAVMAVEAVRSGRAQVLMKGLVGTADLLRAVLDKERGLLPPGRIMSHVAAIEAPAYHKLIFATDVAVIPRPTLDQMHAMLTNAATLCRSLGIGCPKVALIHCNEKVSDKFPQTIAYMELMRRAREGHYGEVCVEGPMDVKTALDSHSAAVKGIGGSVAGHADVLLFPGIEAGNAFYKTISLFGHALMSGLLCGTTAPVTLCSRADSHQSKYSSLAMACLAAAHAEATNHTAL